MPAARSAASSAGPRYCGWRREPGKRRTSATASMPYRSRRARNSGSERVECPTVQTVRAVQPRCFMLASPDTRCLSSRPREYSLVPACGKRQAGTVRRRVIRVAPRNPRRRGNRGRTGMQERIAYGQVAPGAVAAMRGLESYVRQSGLEPALLELVRIRASQLNGCAYCLDMHTKDARAAGESEQRLYVLSAWREAPFYSERERAALAWTEAVTRISDGPIPDEIFRSTREHFEEKELVDLTMAIIAINGWNRLAIAFQGEEVGS